MIPTGSPNRSAPHRPVAPGTARSLVALVLAVLALLPALALGAPAAGAGPAQQGTTPPAIGLVSRPPWVGVEDEAAFTVRFAGSLDDASVRIEVRSPVDDLDDLARAAAEDTGRRLFRSPAVPVGLLGPARDATGASTATVVLRTAREAPDEFTAVLREPGVHPVVIELLDARGVVVDEIRTPVVRVADPDDPDEPGPDDRPRMSVLLDLGGPPTLQPDGSRLLGDAARAGAERVAAVVAAHRDLGLSVVAVPDTLDALAGAEDPEARATLDALAGVDAVALPYLPMALRSLQRSELIGLLPPYLERGTAVVADRLDTEPSTTTWDAVAELGRASERVLAELGVGSVVVPAPPAPPGDALLDAGGRRAGPPPLVTEPLVDAGPRPLTDLADLDGLVVDTALSRALGAALDDAPDAAHVALAELLVATADQGVDAVLVRPPAPPAEDSVLVALLDLLEPEAPLPTDPPIRVGGLGLLTDPTAGTRDGAADADDEPEPLTPDLPPGPDLGAVAGRVQALVPGVDTFAAVLAGRSARADELRLQLAVAVGATTDDAGRDAALDRVASSLEESFGGIRLAGQVDLNLTSRRGTLPVTVTNANPFPVDVLVRLRSDRLAFPDGDVVAVTVDGDEARIDVPVEALATGSVPVFVELWTVDDQRRLDFRALNVRSTAISGVGLLLSVGALAVLVIWWARSWRRSRRPGARPAGGSDGPPTGMG